MRTNKHIHTKDSEFSALVKRKDNFFFSVKSKIINILSFLGHIILVMATQICHCTKKIAIDDTYMNGNNCVILKMYLLKLALGWVEPAVVC